MAKSKTYYEIFKKNSKLTNQDRYDYLSYDSKNKRRQLCQT